MYVWFEQWARESWYHLCPLEYWENVMGTGEVGQGAEKDTGG